MKDEKIARTYYALKRELNRRPLREIVDDYDKVYITVDLPHTKNPKVRVRDNRWLLEIEYDTLGELGVTTVSLPCTVEKKPIEITFKNGVLNIVLAKLFKERQHTHPNETKK